MQRLSASSVLSVSIVVSLVLMLGRLSGFARETFIAVTMGATSLTDTAIVMLTLPDFMLAIFLAGGFNAALIPAMIRLSATDRVLMARQASLLVIGLFALFAALAALWPIASLSLLAPKAANESLAGSVFAFRISLIALPIVAFVGVAGAYLNVKGRFAIPNVSVLVFNLVLIVYLWTLFDAQSTGIVGFAIAIAVATGARLLVHLVLMREFFSQDWSETTTARNMIGRKLIMDFLIGTLGFFLLVGAPILFRTLNAYEGAGELANFNFAQKLFELPSALLIAPIVTIILPKFASLQLAEQEQERDAVFGVAVVAGFTLGAIAAALGAAFMSFLAQAVYLYGAMSREHVDSISQMAGIFLIGLPFLAVAQICIAALNAQGLPLRALTWACCSLALALAVYLGLKSSNLPAGMPAAAMSYAAFNIVLAGLLLRDVARGAYWIRPLVTKMGNVTLRCTLAVAPFVVFTSADWITLTRWQGLGLAIPALGLLLWVSKPYLLPLLRLRVHQAQD